MPNEYKPFNLMEAIVLAAFYLFILGIIMSSCAKEHKSDKEEKHCPSIATSTVPKIVKDSFALKYLAMSAITWYQKDSIGHCAYFIRPVTQKVLAEFNPAGHFISEDHSSDHESLSNDMF